MTGRPWRVRWPSLNNCRRRVDPCPCHCAKCRPWQWNCCCNAGSRGAWRRRSSTVRASSATTSTGVTTHSMPDTFGPYQHRATRAIQHMVEFAPATGGLALWIRHCDVAGDTAAPPAFTDGDTIYYSPGFEALSLPEQAGLVAHETLHVALRHAPRYLDLQRLVGDVDLRLFNICADAIVNAALGHLTWLRLPASSVRLEQVLAKALGQHVDSA